MEEIAADSSKMLEHNVQGEALLGVCRDGTVAVKKVCVFLGLPKFLHIIIKQSNMR